MSSLKVEVIGDGICAPKKPGDVGYDLKASGSYQISPHSFRRVHVNARISMPPNIFMIIRGRSGLAAKGILVHHGTVDCGYQGPLDVILHNNSHETYSVQCGDRIGQAVFFPAITPDLTTVTEFTARTERGESGFGSTGLAG